VNLTLTEERIVHQYSKGLIYKEIAQKLKISPKNVEARLLRARQKNKAKTTAQLCAMWAKALYGGI
jgi:DNA-binding CsgD family transcriptional regulator